MLNTDRLLRIKFVIASFRILFGCSGTDFFWITSEEYLAIKLHFLSAVRFFFHYIRLTLEEISIYFVGPLCNPSDNRFRKQTFFMIHKLFSLKEK